MFPPQIQDRAERLIAHLRARRLTVSTAESCTGGLVAGALTAVAGSSEVFERGFVTYSNDAKTGMIGVDAALIERQGAVSAEVAEAMTTGALRTGMSDLSVAITGIAGPGGGSADKPVGLVYIATATKGGAVRVERFTFGEVGRDQIRLSSVLEALRMLEEAV
ncbi:damage-inducible protein CinA [Hyphomicrobium methylovorum]|uniref:nicotinamide-nucleotide amidohydrolase family protein n=1 Tax=Hyphomicrobium methylovorum TaxID=84 RepID=UPI0015E6AD02|nr:damage-inducible protein CinA [Hyphomicrobium methylovorum]